MGIYNEYLNNYGGLEIKLNSNEIYMDIDKDTLIKMKSCLMNLELNRYPENSMKEIRKLYGKYIDTSFEKIMVGNGSDEVLEIAIGKYVNDKSKVLCLGPDFVMYDFFTEKFNGEIIRYNIELESEFDVKKFISYGKENNVDLIIFSNPNNPTGTVIKNNDIKLILKEFKDKMVIVDEAYYEFYGETMIPYVDRYKNLIVTRTLSKAWGLAALRIGFLISNEDNIKELMNYKVPYTISTFSQKIAEFILNKPSRVKENSKQIIEEREQMYESLSSIQKKAAMNIKFYKSYGNYIYGKTTYKDALIKGLRDHNIYIRNFEGDGFRITIGSPMQNKKVIDVINSIFVY